MLSFLQRRRPVSLSDTGHNNPWSQRTISQPFHRLFEASAISKRLASEVNAENKTRQCLVWHSTRRLAPKRTSSHGSHEPASFVITFPFGLFSNTCFHCASLNTSLFVLTFKSSTNSLMRPAHVVHRYPSLTDGQPLLHRSALA
ncbi:hypothetical protein LZ31DRAFT_30097 [Colletotrichum somersetense]|nr:hypothetical protein LZ31DRAFT_30097 [Colletotrichum somersetense]